MGVRESLIKMLGGSPAGVALPQAMRDAAEVAAGIDRPFSPGVPINPSDGFSRVPRSHDFTTGYNIAARPRSQERVSFDTLRSLVEAYDVAQMCIWHRINSVRSLPWTLVSADWAEGEDVSKYKEIGMAALYKPDRRLHFKPWLAKYLYDVLAFDAGTLYRMRNNAHMAVGLEVIDGTTIAPLLDAHGRMPMRERDDAEAPPAYVQYAQGVPWNWLTDDDIIYQPYQPKSNSPYGWAPIEQVLMNANTDLRFQAYFLSRFTEGNIPEAFAAAPEGWSPEQIEQYQAAWDALLLGDVAVKSQVKWVPHGTDFAWSNEKEFDDSMSLFLMRKTCAMYHVVPSDLGFTEDVNRATGETQVDVQFRIGDLPLVEHVQDILNGFLQNDLRLPLKFQFDTGQEKEDRLATAQADKIYIESGVVSASEVRERVYGLSEPNDQPVPRFIFSTRAGPIPLSALFAVAGPVDVASAAPVPGAALPHKPFALIEGVAPQEPPKSPPLAVERYPQENAASVQAAVADSDAPVVKTEGAGLTTGNSPTSYDLIGDEDDTMTEVAKAAEVAAFARFERSRVKAGKWRDFEFLEVDGVTAQRLNARGRAAVRKAAGELVAAGLAVQAVDTGRVLMLQRGHDLTDPASGMWEFPGGCLEEGETPFDAAVREWQEETGCIVPDGDITGDWASGAYRGYVLTITTEDKVAIGDRGAVLNPDDPDGDEFESLAWFDPAHLEGNPALRAELRDSLPVILDSVAVEFDRVIDDAEDVLKAGDARPKGRASAGWRAGASKTPAHEWDLRVTDHYAPLIAGALQAAFPLARVREAVASVAGLVMKAGADGLYANIAAQARAVLATGIDESQLEALLRKVIADGYATGSFAASQQLGSLAVTLPGIADMDWSAWSPGEPVAAALLADGGMVRMLDDVGITIRGITDTALENMGNRIAAGVEQGQSVDWIARDVRGYVGDPARALRIAHTETARAQHQASLSTYGQNGVAEWTWVLSENPCPECEDAAAGGPYLVGTDEVEIPLHPYCRCAPSPVVESIQDVAGDEAGAGVSDLFPAEEEEAAAAVDDLAARDEAASEDLNGEAEGDTGDSTTSAPDDTPTPVADELTGLSDDELGARLTSLYEAGDFDSATHVEDEMARRDAVDKEQRLAEEKRAKERDRREARTAKLEAERDKLLDEAVAAGEDYEEAYARIWGKDYEKLVIEGHMAALRAAGYEGRSFDALCKAVLKDETERAWRQAEDDCRGVLVNKEGLGKGIDGKSLFTGPEARARKYASRELLDWWQTHEGGRITLEDVKGIVMGKGNVRGRATAYFS